MADGDQTGFPQVSAPASAAVEVPEEEEENNEDAESGNSVDDEDMDDMNHTALPKEVVRPNTPTVRRVERLDCSGGCLGLMADLLHADMFKVLSDMLRSEALLIQRGKSAKFGYLPMMTVATLGALNTESFCA